MVTPGDVLQRVVIRSHQAGERGLPREAALREHPLHLAPRDDDDHASAEEREEARRKRLVDGKWHALDGEPQTDALFEKEIVERMGRAFYRRTFAPAIEDARTSGKSYESIRDTIRKGWKPN